MTLFRCSHQCKTLNCNFSNAHTRGKHSIVEFPLLICGKLKFPLFRCSYMRQTRNFHFSVVQACEKPNISTFPQFKPAEIHKFPLFCSLSLQKIENFPLFLAAHLRKPELSTLTQTSTFLLYIKLAIATFPLLKTVENPLLSLFHCS